MTNLLGYARTMTIISSVQPPNDFEKKDRLIFTKATNGMFAVSKAYVQLRETSSNQDPLVKQMWKQVWGKGNVIPRLSLFLWKLLLKDYPWG